MKQGDLLLLSGNANKGLAQKIAKSLGVELGDASIDSFSDGETRVKIKSEVRGKDVFIIQPTSFPPNQNYMELFITLDALRRASADRITAVIPYFGYARQDRKDQPRVPITAKLIANLLTAAGASRVLTLDLHAHQIQGFFDIQLDHIYAVNAFVDHLKDKLKDPVVVAPDAGAAKMAFGFAKRLNCEVAIIDKRRENDKETKAMHVLGDIEGKDALIVDDIIATGGTLVAGAAALRQQGARSVRAAISHGVLSGPALERIEASQLDELCITDTIGHDKLPDNITVLSIADLIGEAIKRIHGDESISKLFEI